MTERSRETARAKERLRAFVIGHFYIPSRPPFDETTSFVEHGIIDSAGVLELVAFVEGAFGITIADDELVRSNFDSIAALAQFIHRKRGCGDVLHR